MDWNPASVALQTPWLHFMWTRGNYIEPISNAVTSLCITYIVNSLTTTMALNWNFDVLCSTYDGLTYYFHVAWNNCSNLRCVPWIHSHGESYCWIPWLVCVVWQTLTSNMVYITFFRHMVSYNYRLHHALLNYTLIHMVITRHMSIFFHTYFCFKQSAPSFVLPP